jgi:uncharacterized membrane protein
VSRRRSRERTAAARSTPADRARPAPAPAAGSGPQAAIPQRRTAIDALRGGAICLMVVYHFCFDLRFYRVIAADFERDPFWLGFRALIVTSFMALVGVSLVLADRAHRAPAARAPGNRAAYWKRIGAIAGCALLATLGSYLLFPQRFIYFGILHCIAAASLLAQPLVRRPAAALALGAVVVVAGLTLQHAAFDARALSWIGFTTTKPATEDYVPLAPWAGIVLIGIAVGHALVRTDFRALRPLAAAPAWLQWLGRHSLAVYMVHQPLLLGVLWVIVGR